MTTDPTPTDFDAECRSIAAEFGRPVCDGRWIEGNAAPEVYMAGGVWLAASYARKLKEESDYAPRFE